MAEPGRNRRRDVINAAVGLLLIIVLTLIAERVTLAVYAVLCITAALAIAMLS